MSKKGEGLNSAPSPVITENRQARVKNEEKDREIWVGENRLYLGEDGILYETLVGEQDEKIVRALHEASIILRNMTGGKVNCLVDLNKAGKVSSEARKIGQEMLEDERIGKVALFGLHPVARVLAAFVLGITRKKDTHFFKTKEEALAWLKQ